MDTVDVLTEVGGMPPRDAALRFAVAGVPVFPCVPGAKRPLVRHGFHDATADTAQVASWWLRWPTANIGIPTGRASGVDVVDVDVHPTGTGFPAFRAAHHDGYAVGWTALVRTPSGGLHAYFPAHPTRVQPSWQAARAYIDFRGDGGYIIAPPSTMLRPDGVRAPYRLIVSSGQASTPIDATRLRKYLDPRPAVTAPHPVSNDFRRANPKVLAGWVADRAEGERNRGLFWAACRLVEAGVSPADTMEALGPAAAQAGLPAREIESTIRSAYRANQPVAPRSPTLLATDRAYAVSPHSGRRLT